MRTAQYRYFLLLLALGITSVSDSTAQRTNYQITASLDTARHTVNGTIQILYTNNSDKHLDSIGIHLWANAYGDKSSSLVDQMLFHGDLSLYRASREQTGGLFNLLFSSDKGAVRLKYDEDHADTGWIILAQSLPPGGSITLSSPYLLQVPQSFSRLGRSGNAYQITQWYPHIAVLDEAGWHMMPYLDQGEYFNEFADYTVTISTPLNYEVAATATKIKQELSGGWVTRTFESRNTIDFAWFASPTFKKTSKVIHFSDQHVTELHVYSENIFNEDWKYAMDYAERALRFYSDWLGKYPYPQMSIVHTPFSKAGYMEYPMLSQISYTPDSIFLDRVIAHEIGHTFLYAIIANNERDHPWMDEGLNSYLENKYMEKYYKDPKERFFPQIFQSGSSMDDYDALQHIVRINNETQPPQTSPQWQKNNSHIVSAYILPAQGLTLMEAALGEEKMKSMFNNYFTEHKFSNVSPNDLEASFESSCNCDLDWYFDTWIHHAHKIDYRIRNLDLNGDQLVIANKSSVSLPLLISEYSRDALIHTQWHEGFEGDKTFTLQEHTDEISLYEGLMGVNKKWWDNIRPRNLIPTFHIIPKTGNYKRRTFSVTPVVGYNINDGGLPGVAIVTDLLPQPRAKFFLMPMYGLESREFRYFAEGRWTGDITTNLFDKYILGFTSSSFGYNRDPEYGNRDHFIKWSPSVAIRFRHDPVSLNNNWLSYRYVNIMQSFGVGTDNTRMRRSYGVHEAALRLASTEVLKPYRLSTTAQAGKGLLRLQLAYNQHFTGRDKLRGLWVRGFLGWLPVYKDPEPAAHLTINGTTTIHTDSGDYMFDEWLLGRTTLEGNVARQIFIKDGGLKTLAHTGFSESWMAASGFSISLPVKVVHAYMDAALYDDAVFQKTSFSYSGGIALILIKDAFEIYLPLLESKDIRDSITYENRKRFLDRISFQARFNLANPLFLADRIQFGY